MSVTAAVAAAGGTDPKRTPAGRIKMLRPPTFEQLRRELQAHGYYHIVHFDGHGGFGLTSAPADDRFKGPRAG